MSDSAIRLRHDLHRHPELAGREVQTAQRIVQFFRALQPDRIIEGLGGYGVAIVFCSQRSGPTVLLRCELDAVPVEETATVDYHSRVAGVAHACGHDGHMAILAAVGIRLAAQRPDCGRVVLLYQPAEETGEGATSVLQDPRFAEIRPDYAFAAHNVPGAPLGQILLREGPFACASRGMSVRLAGLAGHAALPETGRSPARAMCAIMQGLASLPSGLVPPGETAFATVVGARLGDKAFGMAPDTAYVWATLRSETDETMAGIVDYAETLVRTAAAEDALDVTMTYEDIFPATCNTPRAAHAIRAAASPGALRIPGTPFRWSEDFGRFTAIAEGALFGIGAGTDQPDLHNPGYDFPDALIPRTADLFGRIVNACLAVDHTD